MAWLEGAAICHVLHSLVLEYNFLFSIVHSSKKPKQDLSLVSKLRSSKPGGAQAPTGSARAVRAKPWLGKMLLGSDCCFTAGPTRGPQP